MLAALFVLGGDGMSQEPAKPEPPQINEKLADYKKVDGIEGDMVVLGSDVLNNLVTLWAEGYRRHYPNVRFGIEGKG
jgi:phosphate transport system substrate-binding protein